MSTLTNIKIIKAKENSMQIEIVQIHPDAYMDYLLKEGEKYLTPTSLFLISDLLERRNKKKHPLYKAFADVAKTVCELEDLDYNENYNLTDIEGTTLFVYFPGDFIQSCEVIENHLNDNWDQGLFDDVTIEDLRKEPFISKLPSLKIEIKLKDNVKINNLMGLESETSYDPGVAYWL